MRHRLLALVPLLLSPTLALAQQAANLVFENGDSFLALSAGFGAPLESNLGPAPLVATDPVMACGPLSNADEIEGTIAFIMRGECAFVLKVQNAVAAGAVAVVVYNDARVPDDDLTFVNMSGECAPEVCSAPAVFIARASGLAILDETVIRGDATLEAPTTLPGPWPWPLNTGTVVTSLFDDGFIGTDPSFGSGEGFEFNGSNGLFVSTVLVGQVSGGDTTVHTNPYIGFSEFTEPEPFEVSEGPFEAPFEPFEWAVQTGFHAPLGVTLTLTSYNAIGPPHDDYIVFDLVAENTSGAELDGLYFGIFADWDSGDTSVDDAAGFNEALNLPYVFDPVMAAPYFGVAALGVGALSGWSVDATTADDAQLFEALTTAGEVTADPAERAAVTGVGPYSLAPGETKAVRFAFVAGEDEADLFANAARAQSVFEVAVEETASAEIVALDAVYPNPFASEASVGFALPVAQDVRLAVYDVLGRRVAVLAEGARPVGRQSVEFDAAGLPSGVYLVRLEAGSVHLTQRVTVLR